MLMEQRNARGHRRSGAPRSTADQEDLTPISVGRRSEDGLLVQIAQGRRGALPLIVENERQSMV